MLTFPICVTFLFTGYSIPQKFPWIFITDDKIWFIYLSVYLSVCLSIIQWLCLLQVHLLLKAAPRRGEQDSVRASHFHSAVTSLNNTKHLQTLEEFCCSCESICFSLGFVFRPDASGMFESCILACLVMSMLAVKGACGKKPTVLSVIRHLAFFAEPIHVPNASSLVCVQLPIWSSVTGNVLSNQKRWIEELTTVLSNKSY